MEISNIDELLTSGKTSTQPETPEHQPEVDYGDESREDNSDLPEQSGDGSDLSDSQEEETLNTESDSLDEYGNKKSVDNEVIRERLKKQAESLERKHRAEIQSLRDQLAQQGASREVQQAAKDFEYNPDATGDWQQQLASFVKQTVNSMGEEKKQAEARAREQQVHAEFETKFRQGMSHFDDFVEVVGEQPISDAMTIATRGMKDPAAFLYAAAKRHPQELQRIAGLKDQYAQMMEMGKLEERMRKSKPGSVTPRPVGKTKEDMTIPHKNNKEPTIEDLIAHADAKRRAQLQARRR